MSCHGPVDREVMVRELGYSFVEKQYRTHRETVLVEREMALLPETQDCVANYRLCDTLRQENKRLEAKVDSMWKELMTMRHQINRNHTRVTRIEVSGFVYDGIDDTDDGVGERAHHRRTFFMGCSNTECRGFVVAPKFECGTCGLRRCPTCHDQLLQQPDLIPHACDPDRVKTAELIRRDTRPCPKCAVPIHKVSGCSQMWCTQCHVTFDWRSGKIELGRTHNPHFYEWLRNRSDTGAIAREPGDDPDAVLCLDPDMINDEMLPDAVLLERWVRQHNIHAAHPRWHSTLLFWHRTVRHITWVEIPRYQTYDEGGENTLRWLRMLYLLKRIERDEWKRRLLLFERGRARHDELRQVYQMVAAVVAECLAAVVSNLKEVPDALREMKGIADHANDAFVSIAKRYNCARRSIFIPANIATS